MGSVDDQHGLVGTVHDAIKRGDKASRAAALSGIHHEWTDRWRWYYDDAERFRAFASGDQWETRAHVGHRRYYRNPPTVRSTAAPRVTVNIIGMLVDQANSLKTGEEGIFGCVAATEDRVDSTKAQAGDALLEHFWRTQDLGTGYSYTGRDNTITGTSFVLPRWDSTRGTETVRFTMDGSESELSGDLRFDYPTERQVAFDPTAKHPHDGIGVFYSEELGEEIAYEQWPELKNEYPVPGGSGSLEPSDYQRVREQSRLQENGGSTYARGEDSTRRVPIVTFWMRATPAYPRGYMAIFSGSQMLYEGENDVYARQDEPDNVAPSYNWPIFAIRDIPRPNSPWGMGRVEPLIGLQKSLNGCVNKGLTHLAKCANAKVEIPKSLDSEWTDEIGQKLRVSRANAGLARYIEAPPMSPEYQRWADWYVMMMEKSIGVSPATQGQAPSAHSSGRETQLLQQRDVGRLANAKLTHDQTWAKIQQYALRLFRRYATTDRMIAITGENRATAVQRFSGANLAAFIDVQVYNDNALPRDPTARALQLDRLVQNGAINLQDPKQRSQYLSAMRLNDFKAFNLSLAPHRHKATRENDRILNAEPVEVWHGDDDTIHLAVLDELMTSEEYENKVKEEMAEGRSPTQEMAESHHAQHQSQLMGKQQGAAAPQAMPQPQPMPGGPTMPAAMEGAIQ